MKSFFAALIVALVACGSSFGQEEPGPGFEHLKGYGPMLGTWRCEGPLLEDVPGIAERGTDFEWQFSWKRILNKNVVEANWTLKFEGGTELVGKALQGWNADKKEIVSGSMNSLGGMDMGSVVLDEVAKTLTLTVKGIDGEGKETSLKAVVTVMGKDTLTWQASERTGGIVEGPSPIYTFKRVKRARKAAK